MGLKAPANQGKKFDPIPADTYPAICYSIVDCGRHYDKRYDKLRPKLIITWELPTERITVKEQDLPRAISCKYTNSMHENAILRKHIESWRKARFTEEEAKAFDIRKLLGQGCLLTITNDDYNGNTYANVNGVTALMKGQTLGAPENKTIVFDLDDPDALEKMKSLPEWQQNYIKESVTYKEMMEEAEEAPHHPPPPDSEAPTEMNPDEIPF